MNANTRRSLRSPRDGGPPILKLDQDAYRNEELRAHSVLTFDDIVRMRVLQRMIEAGLNLKSYGAITAEKAARCSYDLRASPENEKDPRAWLLVVPREGVIPHSVVSDPLRSAELPAKILEAGGAGFVFNVDLIVRELQDAMVDIGAMRVGVDGLLRNG